MALELNATVLETKPKYDVQFKVLDKSGNAYRYKCTNMVVDANQEQAFKRGELWHLPIVLKSTKDSVLTIEALNQE